MQIKKRDGRIVSFDKSYIENAIQKACDEVKENACPINEIVEKVTSKCHDGIDVEAIQDYVEQELITAGAAKVAKAYILYRNKRNIARNSNSNQVISDIIAAKKNDVTRENANMNADSPAGMMMKIASERSREYVDEFLLTEEARNAVAHNLLHIHDKDYYPSKSLTCCQSPIDKLLKNGFLAGHGESRPAKRIETAAILACISLQTTQNEQHGGQAIPAFDYYMAPYVRKTYIEEIKKIEGFTGNDYKELYDIDIKDYLFLSVDELNGIERVKQTAINNTVDRTHQAMESFVHNMNTIHSRGGNQVVFSSVNYGTDTSAEGRCVIRELLKTTYRGVGNGSTAIFPIQIWKMKNGINKHPGEPNYDLFEFACKVTAKRFFPNFLNLDAPFNKSDKWKVDDPERYKYEVATMGCVDGEEVITWKTDSKIFVTSFREFWNYCSKKYEVQESATEGAKEGEFINLEGIQIQDADGFVDCLRVIKNPDLSDWVLVTLSNGRQLMVTSNHPWSICTTSGEKIVETKDLHLDDIVTASIVQPTEERKCQYDADMAWLKGFILCDGCYDGQMMSTIGLGETDICDKYCKVFSEQVGSKTFVREQHRGAKGDYLELKNYTYGEGRISKFKQSLLLEFRGLRKAERNIPTWVFNAPSEIRAAFLAGMMDADGYINAQRDRAKCQIGSTNKKLALQTMLLAQSLGAPSKVYTNHYKYEDKSCIRYRVEFDAFESIAKHMVSNKKKDHIGEYLEPICFDSCRVTKIESIGFRDECSFDVTTSSEHFIVSGIRSHNCRTRVFEDRFDESTSIGRGNLSFSTINLPGLALSVMSEPDQEKRIEAFFDKLKNMVGVTGRQLYDRYQFQCTAMAKQFPLLMSGMWVGSENLKPEDEVRSVLKHGTLGIGFIGLAECLIALIGKHHGESEEAQQLGLRIITFMRDEAKKLSDHYDLNYSILATPAEGLSGKFTKKDKKKYGVVKGVTDKDYYTNSNHVPVYYHCSAAHKAKIEAPYHDLTRGGHIFYVELDGDATHNVEAIIDIVKLMDKYNIGYGSVNHNRNRCLDCGYEDSSKGLEICPCCGSKRIDTLQRITGYLVGTTDRWNSGKLAELNDRVTHDR